jgi:peptidoglycan-associated lipoprotein
MRSLLKDTRLLALAVAGSLSLLLACGGDEKKPPETAKAPPPQPTAQAAGEHASGEMPATMTTPPRTAPAPQQGAPIVVEEEVQTRCDLPVAGEEAPQFDYGEAELNEQGEEILDAVATCLEQGKLEGQGIRIVGRADPRGSEQYNMDLGMQRAVAVREYLFERGVSPGSIVVTSEGEREAGGDDEEGWAQDRRVEIEIATPKAGPEQPEESPAETPEDPY